LLTNLSHALKAVVVVIRKAAVATVAAEAAVATAAEEAAAAVTAAVAATRKAVAVATAVAAGMAAVVDTIKIIDIIITKQFENPFHINEKDFFCIRMMTSDNC
jgi:hypothetical protein